MLGLFSQVLTCLFEPFWGCIGNSININRSDGYWNNSLPTAVHWVNYFGYDVIKHVGVQKIEKANVETIEKLGKGYFIKLKKTPIDDELEKDLILQVNANKYFKF